MLVDSESVLVEEVLGRVKRTLPSTCWSAITKVCYKSATLIMRVLVFRSSLVGTMKGVSYKKAILVASCGMESERREEKRWSHNISAK